MDKKANKKLSWWQLSFIGVGCIIGTGFFLGSSIAIQLGGFAVILAYILAGLTTYIVFMALAAMTTVQPEQGSFRTYSKLAFGRWAGFCNGWVYWLSEMLIMGSQLVALGLFTQYWFPAIPLWVLTLVFAVLGLLVIFIGVEAFERLENLFAIIKLAAIIMFLIIVVLGIIGLLTDYRPSPVQSDKAQWLPQGFTGFWGALLYAYYAYGGIEIMGLMATQLQDTNEASKSGKWMLLLLTTIYTLSMIAVLIVVSWANIDANESPFVTALHAFQLPYLSDVFNAVFIIAGFSTLVAALYAVTTMLVSLSADGDAPKLFSPKSNRDFPLSAICLSTAGLLLSIIIAMLLPGKIYEYMTTAAGLLLILNWLFILFSFRRLHDVTRWQRVTIWVGVFFLSAAMIGAWFQEDVRPSVYVCIALIGAIAISWFVFKWYNREKAEG
ncbi:amino acid permease [Pontibacillus litoralis]|uniref:Transporter n=1 Tax=Pontibacillus litoralis JSM 072002 TaxID=1385512 RepID=A0A0A5G1I3_9BACI|nr:amino acid permease [Pontibacillus litoralis]KGX84958.1 transporter [Pontibacillus litoralis JSM 072002]